MKYFHRLILTGLMIHLLPLSAEIAQAEESQPTSLALIAEKEEAALTALDEELSLLDEEFEEFKEELLSMEEMMKKKEVVTPAVETAAVETQAVVPETVAVAETTLPVVEAVPEITLVSDEGFEAEPDVVFNALLPEIENAFESQDEDAALPMQTAMSEEELEMDVPATLTVQTNSAIGEIAPLVKEAVTVDLKQAFAGSPVIYSLLFAMSVFSVCIWLYSVLSIQSSARVSSTLLKNMQNKLSGNNFDEALSICEENKNLFCKMVSSGIHSRRHGLPVMIEAMKAEGKRATISSWQKIGMLNDIAIIAPMIGLLGTVLGMFYAFYDVNRSIESISTLFDGLGISVGTTVAGLVVAILALILHSTAKYRLVKALAVVENEAQSIANQIDDRTSIYKG